MQTIFYVTSVCSGFGVRKIRKMVVIRLTLEQKNPNYIGGPLRVFADIEVLV